MSDDKTLIPPPPVVRNRLAINIRERRMLRTLLRLSIQAAEYRREQETKDARSDRKGVKS